MPDYKTGPQTGNLQINEFTNKTILNRIYNILNKILYIAILQILKLNIENNNFIYLQIIQILILIYNINNI